MLIEMAQMSAEDGMVMQIHAGSTRSTNRALADRFGPDMGADIPRAMNWVDGLDALLNRVGNDPRFRLIVFTLDEASYARELAPMAGHWPALRLGPPWWFHDSLNGIRRYFDAVVETAGYRNLAGFNDDTRAFLSIPARHDLWRRGVALHLGDQVARGVLRQAEAECLAPLLAVDLARDAYRLNEGLSIMPKLVHSGWVTSTARIRPGTPKLPTAPRGTPGASPASRCAILRSAMLWRRMGL
jgi:glucuronate isomerase